MLDETEEDAALFAVLIGAAFRCRAFPEIVALNEDRLWLYLRAHRLIHRLYDRVAAEGRPAWMSRGFRTRLLFARSVIERQQRAQLCALQEVIDALPAGNVPPIVIKGPALFALTGDPRHRHPSGDLDPFPSDGEAFITAAQTRGFQFEGLPKDRNEYGTLLRADCLLEPHRFLHSYRYPAGVRSSDLRPALHPALWRQIFPPVEYAAITYDDLNEECQSSLCQEFASFTFRVPSREMQALLLCVHADKHRMIPKFYRVYLYELADIYDMIVSANFNHAHFCELVARFQAEDAILSIHTLFHAILGTSPFGAGAVASLPVWLTYAGGWADVFAPSEFIFPVWGESRLLETPWENPLTRRLIATPVRIGERVEHQREIWHTFDAPPFPFDLTILPGPIARFELPLLPEGEDWFILIHRGARYDRSRGVAATSPRFDRPIDPPEGEQDDSFLVVITHRHRDKRPRATVILPLILEQRDAE